MHFKNKTQKDAKEDETLERLEIVFDQALLAKERLDSMDKAVELEANQSKKGTLPPFLKWCIEAILW